MGNRYIVHGCGTSEMHGSCYEWFKKYGNARWRWPTQDMIQEPPESMPVKKTPQQQYETDGCRRQAVVNNYETYLAYAGGLT